MTGLGRSGVGSAAPPARLLHRAVLVRIQPADWQSALRGDGARPAGGSRSEVDCPTVAGLRRAGPSPPGPATATWVVTDSSGRACRSWCGDVCRRLSAGCPGRYSESSSPRARLPHCSSRGRRREFRGRGRRSEWRLWNPPKLECSARDDVLRVDGPRPAGQSRRVTVATCRPSESLSAHCFRDASSKATPPCRWGGQSNSRLFRSVPNLAGS